MKGSDGRLKDILEARLDKAWIKSLKLGLKFIHLVSKNMKGVTLYERYKPKAIKVLATQSYISNTVVGRIENRIIIPDANINATKLAVIYTNLFSLMELLNEANHLLIDSLKVSNKLGIDVTKQKKALENELINRAENISVFLEISQNELTGIHAGLSASQKDDELNAKQNLVNGLITKLTVLLGDVLDMMEQVGLKTTKYRQQILSATGEITAKVADVSVITGLFLDWGKKLTKTIAEEGPNVIFKILIFIFIIYISRKLFRLTRRVMIRAFNRTHLKSSELLRNMAISIIGNIIFLLGILIALSQLGISLGPLLAGLGVAGFVIGFALQDTLSNFASGMMILVYRPFDVGDLVDVGGVFGIVDHMSLVNTTIMTLDNQTIIVPNSKIWGDVIKNITAPKIRRVDMTFSISYNDDIEKTEQILADIVAQHDKTLDEPEPLIHLHELGESSVDFIVKPWVNRDDYWQVYWDITRSVKMRFDQEGISIPFPQRDVHIHNVTD